MNATITLNDFLRKGKTFVIPSYQRGYVWGKNRIGENDSVSNLMDDIIARYENGMDMFLQGFTVTENEDSIVLIDGQQRTTCLYLLFKWLGYEGKFDMRYDIRKMSNEYLQNLDVNDIEEKDEHYQDIYFFKKTLRIIKEKLKEKDYDKADFLSFLLNRVKFLYVNIEEQQAIWVFTMMNGSRAKMRQEEIIKAEILRLASKGDNSTKELGEEWENNMLRSRYAREWNKWLHWWNRDDVVEMYGCERNTMGLLISSYHQNASDVKLTFESFKGKILSNGKSIDAKRCFEQLRRMQKRFEDAFNNPETHNRIGGILSVFDNDNKRKFITYYFVEDRRDGLKDYYLSAFLGMTHDEIVGHNNDKFAEKYDNTLAAISNDFAYIDSKEETFRLLLRLNIDQDIEQKRNFCFKIWKGGNRSLEHIQVKSKVIHEKDGKWYNGNNDEVKYDSTLMKRTDIKAMIDGKEQTTTEHCIGNLVLLYQKDNLKFRTNDFAQKKRLFFSPKGDSLESRHLLHTICVFAEKEEWNGEAIVLNKFENIEKFKSDYKKLREKYDYEE